MTDLEALNFVLENSPALSPKTLDAFTDMAARAADGMMLTAKQRGWVEEELAKTRAALTKRPNVLGVPRGKRKMPRGDVTTHGRDKEFAKPAERAGVVATINCGPLPKAPPGCVGNEPRFGRSR